MEKKGKSEGYDIENILAIEVPEGILSKPITLNGATLLILSQTAKTKPALLQVQ
jgi:hypothetical protein